MGKPVRHFAFIAPAHGCALASAAASTSDSCAASTPSGHSRCPCPRCVLLRGQPCAQRRELAVRSTSGQSCRKHPRLKIPLLQFQKRFLATSANKAFVINRPVRFSPLLRSGVGDLAKPDTKKWTRLSPCPICTSNLLIFIQS